MANTKPHCSVSYHKLEGAKLETFGHAVSNNLYSHNPPFTAPPLTQAAFDALVNTYHDKYEDYQNGGKYQKGDYLDARKALIAALDTTADYVDGLSGLDEETILKAGFTPTKTGETKAEVPVSPSLITSSSGSTTGEFLTECNAVPGAEYYPCLIAAGEIPPGIGISKSGQVIITDTGSSTTAAKGGTPMVVAVLDLTKSRKKQFTQLSKGTDYYVYYAAANAAGVSSLSKPIVVTCT